MPNSPGLSPNLFNPKLYRSVLNIWFQDLPNAASAPPYPVLNRWFGLNSETGKTVDSQCSSAAKDALLSIKPDRYPLPQIGSSAEPAIAEPFLSHLAPNDDLAPEQTALALVILFDQFTRNIFRDDQKVIYTHYDRISRSLATEFLARGLDDHERWRDSPPWQNWFYMPLMHSESRQDHEQITEKWEQLKARMEEKGDKEAVGYTDRNLHYEERHKAIIDRFGRYPHRNGVIGRESTKEEKEYMADGGETFGT